MFDIYSVCSWEEVIRCIVRTVNGYLFLMTISELKNDTVEVQLVCCAYKLSNVLNI